MELVIKARSGKLSERQRGHIEEKLSKLDRYMEGLDKATVELYEEQHKHGGTMHRVQATIQGSHGVVFRSEQQAPELYAAVDSVHDTLQRQITRYKDKHWRRGKLRHQNGQIVDVGMLDQPPMSEEDTNNMPKIVRTKEFQVKPMYSDEAVEQMEMLGHDFFVFRDAETNSLNFIYRRKDGNYGLIVPDSI